MPGQAVLIQHRVRDLEGWMHHHNRTVQNCWGVSSALALPVAVQPYGPAPQLASIAPHRLSPPVHQSLLAVLCVAPQVGLQALAVREGLDPSAPKEDFPQGCDVRCRPVKCWARRRLLGPHRPCRVLSRIPKQRWHPPHRRDALVRPAVAFRVAVPALVRAGGGARIGMIQPAWSSCAVAV